MLEDSQLEVRLGASSTLSGMIRCSPARLRSETVLALNEKFTDMLLSHPLPKKPKAYLGGVNSGMSTPNTGTSTPNPEHTKLVVTRHAAVLGLGALVQAFPYASPPPKWIPGVLTTVSPSYPVPVATASKLSAYNRRAKRLLGLHMCSRPFNCPQALRYEESSC